MTNQRASGRCWIFACLNCMRIPFMKKQQLEDFEFSQSYLFFWDKVSSILESFKHKLRHNSWQGLSQDFKNACPKKQFQNFCPSKFSYVQLLQILIPIIFNSLLCQKVLFTVHFSHVHKMVLNYFHFFSYRSNLKSIPTLKLGEA